MIFLDFETRARVDLKTRGLDNYVRDPEFKVLLTAWGVDRGPVRLWEAHRGPMPGELREQLESDALVVAHNATFERLTLRALGYDIPASRFRDTMVMAHAASLPGSLDEVGRILGLPDTYRKLDGNALIRRFCTYKAGWRGPDTDPDDWKRFCDYCVRDAESARKIYFTLEKFSVDWDMYALDQKINDRGMPVDVQFCSNALTMADREKTALLAELREITGLDNPNSVSQLLPWLRERGYPYNNLRKAQVKRAIELGVETHVLSLRQSISKTSVAKYKAILDRQVGGRLRYGFQFLGAARTGRWAGRGVQFQNLPRPAKEVDYEQAQQTIRDGGQSTLQVLSSCIRSAFTAPVLKHFVVCDLSSIEDRMVGWLSGCERILQEHRDGLDPYKAFARYLFNVEYDEVTPQQRQDSKPPKLGCAYGLGAGEVEQDKNGDIVKTGLLGYAESMGIPMTAEQCARAVGIYRDTYPEVVQHWYDLENAAMQCIRTQRPQHVGRVVFDIQAPCLRIRLPSGRHLCYVRPRVETKRFKRKRPQPGQDPFYTKTCVTYETQDQTWARIPTFGPRWLEQITQACARDVLAYWMRAVEDAGYPVVGHAHDEIICELPVWKKPDLEALLGPWFPGLPLAAKGFVSWFYFKG